MQAEHYCGGPRNWRTLKVYSTDFVVVRVGNRPGGRLERGWGDNFSPPTLRVLIMHILRRKKIKPKVYSAYMKWPVLLKDGSISTRVYVDVCIAFCEEDAKKELKKAFEAGLSKHSSWQFSDDDFQMVFINNVELEELLKDSDILVTDEVSALDKLKGDVAEVRIE